jgi:hypothetical protein
VKNTGLNKFVCEKGESQRGLLLAVNRKGTEGIILSLTGETYGQLLRVREDADDQWPQVVERVERIPRNKDEWHVVAYDTYRYAKTIEMK